MVYYSEKIHIKISKRNQNMGQSPSSCLFPVEFPSREHLILPEMICDNIHELSPIMEAHLSLGVQELLGVSHKGMEVF